MVRKNIDFDEVRNDACLHRDVLEIDPVRMRVLSFAVHRLIT
jgi:hypothetical protein